MFIQYGGVLPCCGTRPQHPSCSSQPCVHTGPSYLPGSWTGQCLEQNPVQRWLGQLLALSGHSAPVGNGRGDKGGNWNIKNVNWKHYEPPVLSSRAKADWLPWDTGRRDLSLHRNLFLTVGEPRAILRDSTSPQAVFLMPLWNMFLGVYLLMVFL